MMVFPFQRALLCPFEVSSFTCYFYETYPPKFSPVVLSMGEHNSSKKNLPFCKGLYGEND